MNNADFGEYNLLGGSARAQAVFRTDSTNSQTVLRPTSTRPQSLVCAQNLDNGRAFSAGIADSINRSVTSFNQFVRAWDRGSASGSFPCNIYLNWSGRPIAGITRYWTRTDSHDGGFYLSREFYGSRNSLRKQTNQMVAFTQYLRTAKMLGFLIASLEQPTGRICYFVPWEAVLNATKTGNKIELFEIEAWPGFKLNPRTGLYDIQLEKLAELIKKYQPATEDNEGWWW